MVSISVRVVEEKTVLLKWIFFYMEPYLFLTYEDVLKKIIEENDDICKGAHMCFATASSTFSCIEEIRGEPNVNVIDINKSFGMRFFTLYVTQHKDGCACQEPTDKEPTQRNAFDVMMESARRVALDAVPVPIPENSNLDKMYNAVLQFCLENGSTFPSNSSASVGKTFIKHLASLLWYLDGHYSKINDNVNNENKVPETFVKNFSGINSPELYKHRKRANVNLTAERLEKLCIQIKEVTRCMPFFQDESWKDTSFMVFRLLSSIDEYVLYLRKKCKLVKFGQSTPRSNFEEKANVVFLKANTAIKIQALRNLDNKLNETAVFTPICVREEIPAGLNRKQLYALTQELREKGLSSKCVYYVYNSGGPKANLHFIWKIDENDDESNLINKCCLLVRKIEQDIPIYERRITKREFMNTFGFVSNPVTLRGIFRELTGDQSAASSVSESEIDQIFKYAVLSKDPGILVDLRHASPEHKKDSFRPFFQECEKYLSEDVGVAVQEHRHGEMLYLAKAVSIRDLHTCVKERMPEDANIPSVKWLRYQFQPMNPRANTSKYYKGNINVKMMVQKRQVINTIICTNLSKC